MSEFFSNLKTVEAEVGAMIENVTLYNMSVEYKVFNVAGSWNSFYDQIHSTFITVALKETAEIEI